MTTRIGAEREVRLTASCRFCHAHYDAEQFQEAPETCFDCWCTVKALVREMGLELHHGTHRCTRCHQSVNPLIVVCQSCFNILSRG